MLNSFSHLTGSTVTATDGSIGHVKAAFFDDQSWTIRYLVVDTGTWLPGREVLISPYSIKQSLSGLDNIEVSLTREQVKVSRDIDTHQPISRQHEREYLNYYEYRGTGVWVMGAYPLRPPYRPRPADIAADNTTRQPDRFADVHLRSSVVVTGYEIRAPDESIGHVKDFVFEDQSWAIRYVVVDTRNWWPGGRKVLVATHWIDRIDWAMNTVHVTLTREQIKNSPEYHEKMAIDRDYEQRLHAGYNRNGYWD